MAESSTAPQQRFDTCAAFEAAKRPASLSVRQAGVVIRLVLSSSLTQLAVQHAVVRGPVQRPARAQALHAVVTQRPRPSFLGTPSEGGERFSTLSQFLRAPARSALRAKRRSARTTSYNGYLAG